METFTNTIHEITNARQSVGHDIERMAIKVALTMALGMTVLGLGLTAFIMSSLTGSLLVLLAGLFVSFVLAITILAVNELMMICRATTDRAVCRLYNESDPFRK